MSQSLLKVQIGPVQEFIAQARSTRDLWSGSYLLSWLMAHAVKTVVDRCGEESLVFPSAQRQPALDWILGDRTSWTNDQVLTPNIPNTLLATIEADAAFAKSIAEAAAAVFSAEPQDSPKPNSE